jgi:hypothetical protein
MKISPLIIPASIILVLFTACEEESRPRNPDTTAANTGSNAYGYVPGDDTATDFIDRTPPPPPAPTTPAPIVTDQDVIDTQTTPEPTTTTFQDPVAPAPAPVDATRNLQYGTPVPGKAGFVTSPHAPYAGYVDVRGFPPNTEVKDPYSGKIFLVP